MKDKIEAAMRYVYAHFLEEGEPLETMILSRKQPIARARHVLRFRIYKRMAVTMRQIAEAESRIAGTASDHSKISDSLQAVGYGEFKKKAIDEVDKLLDEFEAYWKELQQPSLSCRIRHYYEMPHHALAAIVALAEEFGWAQRDKMDGLSTEFSTVRQQFIEKLIQ